MKDFRAIYQSDPFSYSKSYSYAHFKALKVEACIFCASLSNENKRK